MKKSTAPTPNFSVLMSVYGGDDASQFKSAFDSITSQTLRPNEIVLVQDGPVDKILARTIEELSKITPELVLVRLRKNGGLGIALREGVKHCSHAYIARMDSDDISKNDRFEKQLQYLAKNPNIDMVGSDIIEYDEAMENEIARRIVPKIHDEIIKTLKHRNPFNHVTVIYKKESVLAAGNYLSCPYFEDYYLWCRMAKNGTRFHNLTDSLVNVRSGMAMLGRRGGIKYASYAIDFQLKVYRLKIIGPSQLVVNLVTRVAAAITPSRLRSLIYSRALREKA